MNRAFGVDSSASVPQQLLSSFGLTLPVAMANPATIKDLKSRFSVLLTQYIY